MKDGTLHRSNRRWIGRRDRGGRENRKNNPIKRGQSVAITLRKNYASKTFQDTSGMLENWTLSLHHNARWEQPEGSLAKSKTPFMVFGFRALQDLLNARQETRLQQAEPPARKSTERPRRQRKPSR
jgi:hypothetical protein